MGRAAKTGTYIQYRESRTAPVVISPGDVCPIRTNAAAHTARTERRAGRRNTSVCAQVATTAELAAIGAFAEIGRFGWCNPTSPSSCLIIAQPAPTNACVWYRIQPRTAAPQIMCAYVKKASRSVAAPTNTSIRKTNPGCAATPNRRVSLTRPRKIFHAW